MEGRFERTSRALGQPRKPVGARPTPHELRAFVQVCDALHFGRAATCLGLSKSCLSETIRRLEAKLDVVLFERTSQRVLLTDAGESLVPLAREAVESLEAVTAALTAGQATDGDAFRVGIEGQGFAELNRPILGGLRARHPETPLVVRDVSGTVHSFLDARLDVALVRSPLEDGRLTMHPVATEERGLLVPEGHPAAGAEGLSAVEFLDEPFVAIAPEQPATTSFWIGDELRGGERPRIGGSASTTPESLNAIAYRGLLTTGCASAIRSFPLVPISSVGTVDLSPAVLCVAVRTDDERPIVREFIDGVRVVVAELSGDLPGFRALSTN